MIITERIEMMIIGILGIVMIIAILGVFYGNSTMTNMVSVILGILGGYLGNGVKNQINQADTGQLILKESEINNTEPVVNTEQTTNSDNTEV